MSYEWRGSKGVDIEASTPGCLVGLLTVPEGVDKP